MVGSLSAADMGIHIAKVDRMLRYCISLGFVFVLLGSSLAQTVPTQSIVDEAKALREHVRANFTKYEFQVPMRDGKKLFTTVYSPKDDAKKYPFLLNRTPYSVAPYGIDNYRERLGPSELFQKSGYIFVYQDVRGRWMSEGTFTNVTPHKSIKGPVDCDESTDTFDTIAWLLTKIPNHNGRVGQSGISYPGFYTAAGMIDAHPALKACSPQAPVLDWFIGDDFHHNGCLFLPHAFNFMSGFGKERKAPNTKFGRIPFDHNTPDGYQFFLDLGPLANADKLYLEGTIGFWNEMMRRGTYDEMWQAMNLRPHLAGIKPAVMTVGGWFDAENLFGALECFKSIEKQGHASDNILVMGPWDHGGWSRGPGDSLGNARFGSKTAEFYRANIEFPFFEKKLKDEKTPDLPKAFVFESGTNIWLKLDTWPPKNASPRGYYFQNKGVLGTKAPTGVGSDSYLADPAKPVPHLEKTTTAMDYHYMVADQRHAARRPDVLVYQTPVLTEDTLVAGPIKVDLWIQSTGTDADFVVKVIDVFPGDYPDLEPNPTGVRMGNYQMLIRGEPFRAKFRNSFSKPEPLEPGKLTKVSFTMPDICHSFRPGHRIMVQVQSSWFPLVDRNPQRFCDIYSATEADFTKQTQTIHRSAENPSSVTMWVR